MKEKVKNIEPYAKKDGKKMLIKVRRKSVECKEYALKR